jgi:hypothetical protein
MRSRSTPDRYEAVPAALAIEWVWFSCAATGRARGGRSILGDRRMTVHADIERGLRIEGVFELVLDSQNTRRRQPTGVSDRW